MSSVSLAANGETLEEAVSQLRDYPQLSVGWHINLTSGRPVLGHRVPSLVDRSGRLWGKSKFIARLLSGSIDKKEIGEECRAQLEKITEKGVAVTHVDSHHDVHCLPSLAGLLFSLFKAHGLSNVRYVGARMNFLRRRFTPVAVAVNVFIRLWTSRLTENAGLKGADFVWGYELYHRRDKQAVLSEYIKKCKRGLNLIVCHPGYHDPGTESRFSYRPDRESELKALCHPDLRCLADRHAVVVSF